jgi:hypothetical protein
MMLLYENESCITRLTLCVFYKLCNVYNSKLNRLAWKCAFNKRTPTTNAINRASRCILQKKSKRKAPETGWETVQQQHEEKEDEGEYDDDDDDDPQERSSAEPDESEATTKAHLKRGRKAVDGICAPSTTATRGKRGGKTAAAKVTPKKVRLDLERNDATELLPQGKRKSSPSPPPMNADFLEAVTSIKAKNNEAMAKDKASVERNSRILHGKSDAIDAFAKQVTEALANASPTSSTTAVTSPQSVQARIDDAKRNAGDLEAADIADTLMGGETRHSVCMHAHTLVQVALRR